MPCQISLPTQKIGPLPHFPLPTPCDKDLTCGPMQHYNSFTILVLTLTSEWLPIMTHENHQTTSRDPPPQKLFLSTGLNNPGLKKYCMPDIQISYFQAIFRSILGGHITYQNQIRSSISTSVAFKHVKINSHPQGSYMKKPPHFSQFYIWDVIHRYLGIS